MAFSSTIGLELLCFFHLGDNYIRDQITLTEGNFPKLEMVLLHIE